MKKKKLIKIGSIIAAIIIVILILSRKNIVLKVSEDYLPASTIFIKINPNNKKMYVKETRYSSAYCEKSTCDPTVTEKNTVLNEEEFKLVKKILRKFLLSKEEKEDLAEALTTIADDDKVFYKKEDQYYEQEVDLNNDGIITSREFAYNWLNVILKGE